MKKELIPISRVAQAIHMLCGQKVILGRDLASLYGVTVGALTQAVKRNPSRFPKDFVFQLNAGELANLKSQFVISSWGGRAFVKLRETLETNRELARKFAELEKHVGKHDDEISAVIDAIRQLMAPPEKPRREIGFHVREKAPRYRTRNHR
jgi:hypothetical protein